MLRNIIILVICSCLPPLAFSQLTTGGVPLPVSEQQKKVEHIYIMPSLPMGLLDEDYAKRPVR